MLLGLLSGGRVLLGLLRGGRVLLGLLGGRRVTGTAERGDSVSLLSGQTGNQPVDAGPRVEFPLDINML